MFSAKAPKKRADRCQSGFWWQLASCAVGNAADQVGCQARLHLSCRLEWGWGMGAGACRQPSYPKPLCGEPGPLGKEPGVEGEGAQRSQLRDTSMDCQQEGSLEASGGLQASSSHRVQVIIRSFSPSGADLLGFLEGCSFLHPPPLPLGVASSKEPLHFGHTLLEPCPGGNSTSNGVIKNPRS